jgi:hypothetical protein
VADQIRATHQKRPMEKYAPRGHAVARRKCERCKLSTTDLALHHKSYERLGRESPSDLELLCPNCHKGADVERSVRGQERSSAALYNARLNGWASKRFGEDWQDRVDADWIADQFEQWFEQHADDESW